MHKKLKLSLATTILFLSICTTAFGNQIEHSVGGGLGLPYGGVGANYELGLNDFFAPTVGLGWLPENLGWNAGARLYYPGRDSKVRGRLTALYGTNTVLERNVLGNKDYKTEEGFSGGLGLNWRFTDRWAFDADLFVVDQDVPPGYTKEGSDVKISLGFSRRW